MKKPFIILFFALSFSDVIARWNKLPVIISPKFKKDTISIVKHGAVPGSHALNINSINAAIEACNKKDGGVVLVPSELLLLVSGDGSNTLVLKIRMPPGRKKTSFINWERGIRV